MFARSTSRRVGGLLGLVLAAAVLTPLASAPAGATSTTTYLSSTNAVTWVDGSGRQLSATSMVEFSALPEDDTEHLVVARDTVAGTPDASWGTFDGKPGLREVVPVAPAAGLERIPVIAASDAGVLTITWKPSSCTSPTASCELWFSRIDATGTAVGSPASFTTDQRPTRPLTDGSILLAASDGDLGWRGADGSDRGNPGPTAAQLVGAAVDPTGRLLTTTTDGTITRRAPGTAPDLTLPTTCTTDEGFAIGTAADGGFATTCGSTTPAQVTTTRYAANGAISWTATGADPEQPLAIASHVAVDSTDRVWAAGYALADIGPFIAEIVVAQPYTSAGPGTVAYERATAQAGLYDRDGSGADDLRTGAAGTVVFAEQVKCCNTIEGNLPMDRLNAVVLPRLPQAPMCDISGVTITAATPTTAEVEFITCGAHAEGGEPTGYRIDATGAGGTASTVVVAPSGFEVASGTVGPLLPGRHVRVTVTPFNAVGDSTYAPSDSRDTVLPFINTYTFVQRQVRDLEGAYPTTIPTALIAAVDAETITPTAVITGKLDTGLAEQVVEPVARLYRAYFLRDADPSGLTHWVTKRRNGTKLSTISDTFARSNEFKTRYGTLTNRAFVAQLYQNVFNRPADATGLDFWTNRLDRGTNTRGQVVLQFSESNEFRTTTNPTIEPLAATYLMLGRLPTTTERTTWQSAPDPQTTAATAILTSNEYATRITTID